MAFYVDTSALAKMLNAEPESRAFNTWMRAHSTEVYCSDLVRVELMRVAGRLGEGARVQARTVLSAVSLVAISPAICDTAGLLEPAILRSLDAIHVATALALGDELAGLVTYDDRMAATARELGIPVLAPGRLRLD